MLRTRRPHHESHQHHTPQVRKPQCLVILNLLSKALECLVCGTQCIDLVCGKATICSHFDEERFNPALDSSSSDKAVPREFG
jgi:hypothetical protein